MDGGVRIIRAPNDRVAVIITEAEGVTDDDIGATLASSPAVLELVELDTCIGVVPLGAPSTFWPDGVHRCTALVFDVPPVMWFQKYDQVWEWGVESQPRLWPDG